MLALLYVKPKLLILSISSVMHSLVCSLYSLEQRSLLFQMVYDNLVAQKSSGGPMAGVMFWSAAIEDVWDDG